MDIGVIAKRYAKALLSYAVENKVEETVYQQCQTFIRNYQQLEQLRAVLSDPLLDAKSVAKVICEACGDKPSSPGKESVMQKFAALVVSHHRESIMPFIAHAYVSLYHELKHISFGHLTTAVPVSKEIADKLQKWIQSRAPKGEKINFDTEVNPDLLGGFIFQIDDLRLDASLASQFEKIKKQFIDKNKRIV